MTDRELLELAAKAAQYVIEGDADRLVAQPGRFSGGFSILNDKGGSSLWNPLTDDGDALRLAVRCKIDLILTHSDIQSAFDHKSRQHAEARGKDPYAATRHAIVSAAAEIGKEMK